MFARRKQVTRSSANGTAQARLNTAQFAVAALALEFALDCRWILPLVHEARRYPDIWQPISWFADLPAVFQPVWWNGLMHALGRNFRAIDWSETIVTVGWVFWIPACVGAWQLLRKRSLLRILPFVALLVTGCLYLSLQGDQGNGTDFQFVLQTVVPFFKFFRVASRWGLIFPALLGAIVALEWPELAEWVRGGRALRRLAIGAFLLSSLAEAGWLLYPIHYLPPMKPELAHFLEDVKRAPGTTVLDLPFCVVGGNGVCGGPGYGQCPNYPEATAGACLREWHDKKVYGLYQARMTDSHCQIYQRSPYLSWFDAWKEQRCFSDAEFDAFCAYLGEHPELSAVLLYPDIWIGPKQPGCWAKFEQRLGPAVEEASFFTAALRGGIGINPTRVFRFEPRCRGYSR